MAHESYQNYELAYHITTQLEDADVQKAAQEIEKIVTSHGGRVSFRKDPEKLRLSYPIQHQQHAHFGYVQFQLEDREQLAAMNEQLRLDAHVLRFLLMKFDPAAEKDKDIVRKIAMESRRGRAARPTLRQAPKAAPEVPAVKEEELEKQIDTIIDKM